MDVQPRQYQIPTHLNTPDSLQIGTIRVTMRQLVLGLVAFLVISEVWQQLALWQVDQSWRLVICGLLGVLAYIIAVMRVGGQDMERWFVFVWLPYMARPRVFLWRRLPIAPRVERAEPAKERSLP